MVLVPALQRGCKLPEKSVFPCSVSIMLPISMLSLYLGSRGKALPWAEAGPYLAGSALGGLIAGLWGRRIHPLWLHRIFGAIILVGGIRYLWG